MTTGPLDESVSRAVGLGHWQANLIILSSSLIVVLMVGGTLVVLLNLRRPSA
jgi:hypothetical protein